MVRLPKLFGTSSTRRMFLRSGLAAPAVIGAGLAVHPSTLAFADSDGPTFGDISILRFLAALEILETDLWEQYNEIGGIQDQEERARERKPALYRAACEDRRRYVAIHSRQHR